MLRVVCTVSRYSVQNCFHLQRPRAMYSRVEKEAKVLLPALKAAVKRKEKSRRSWLKKGDPSMPE